MGQKTNPKVLRLGIVSEYDSNWFALKNYGDNLYEDYQIRNFLKQELYRTGVSKIIVNRKASLTLVDVYVARIGIIMSKKGIDIDILQEILSKRCKRDIKVNVIEQKNPDGNAKLLGEWVALQLEKRIPFRRAMKMAVQKALKSGAMGIKIGCSGRLGGVEIARSEWYREGKVPLHTLRADIDYAFSESMTTYGKIGIKVWIYNGEVLTKEALELPETEDIEIEG